MTGWHKHLLKPTAGAVWTGIISASLLEELLVTADDVTVDDAESRA
jgi:hypothetical protein